MFSGVPGPDLAEIPCPLELHRETVHSDWVDYNGHMNVAYYVLVFDHGTDAVLDHLDLGAVYRQRSGCSFFVAEAHITYEAEVLAGETVVVGSRILAFDDRRVVLFHEMRRLGDADATVIASNEVLCIHVDMASRRTLAIPVAATASLRRIAAAHAECERPSRAGRNVDLRAGRPR